MFSCYLIKFILIVNIDLIIFKKIKVHILVSTYLILNIIYVGFVIYG